MNNDKLRRTWQDVTSRGNSYLKNEDLCISLVPKGKSSTIEISEQCLSWPTISVQKNFDGHYILRLADFSLKKQPIFADKTLTSAK